MLTECILRRFLDVGMSMSVSVRIQVSTEREILEMSFQIAVILVCRVRDNMAPGVKKEIKNLKDVLKCST